MRTQNCIKSLLNLFERNTDLVYAELADKSKDQPDSQGAKRTSIKIDDKESFLKRTGKKRKLSSGSSFEVIDLTEASTETVKSTPPTDSCAKKKINTTKKRKNGGEMKSRIDSEQDLNISRSSSTKKLTFLTYNVWFQEEVEVRARMYGIATIVQREKPDFIGFQEVTQNIAPLLEKFLKRLGYKFYHQFQIEQRYSPYFVTLCSLIELDVSFTPFRNSKMGRGLLVGVGKSSSGDDVVIATSHFESPVPPYGRPEGHGGPKRDLQLELSLEILSDYSADIKILMG